MPGVVADVCAVPPKSDYATNMNADANKGSTDSALPWT